MVYCSIMQYEECNNALKRIVPWIDMEAIHKLIDDIPYIDDLQKEFYKTMLDARKELILDFSYKKVLEKDVEQEVYVEPRGPKL